MCWKKCEIEIDSVTCKKCAYGFILVNGKCEFNNCSNISIPLNKCLQCNNGIPQDGVCVDVISKKADNLTSVSCSQEGKISLFTLCMTIFEFIL